MRKLYSRLLVLALLGLVGFQALNPLTSEFFVKSPESNIAPNLVWNDWTHYHNYSEIVNTILYLNETYPGLVDVFSIGKSWLNRTIYCVRLTNEGNSHPKPEVYFDGYYHAREPITIELLLYFLVDSVFGYGKNDTVTRMLDCCEIYVVVAVNVDGFEIVKQNEWQRKNAHPYNEDDDGLLDEDSPGDVDGNGYIEHLYFQNATTYYDITWEGNDTDSDGRLDWIGGVDLNRNFDWNAQYSQGSPSPGDEIFRGPSPFSEPETQAVRDLALQHNFKYALTFHSGTFQVIGCRGLNTAEDTSYRQVTLSLSALARVPYDIFPGGYPTGMWQDFMYSSKGTIALACEIYGNDSALQTEPGPEPNTYWEKGITQFFNPDPDNIETSIQRWLPVFTYIVDRAINESAIPGDVNKDFKVNLSDLVLLARAYNTTPDDSKWNPDADFDKNGTVSLSDLVILAQHYGQHYP